MNRETIKKPTRWRTEYGEKYFYVYIGGSGCKVSSYINNNYLIDKDMYKSGNYFQTEDEARIIADKINEIFKEIK